MDVSGQFQAPVALPLAKSHPSALSNYWIKGWMSHKAGLNDVERMPNRDSNSDPSVKVVTSRYTDYAIAAQIF
jgi:hypothetical protein